jgi:hypothetical protein
MGFSSSAWLGCVVCVFAAGEAAQPQSRLSASSSIKIRFMPIPPFLIILHGFSQYGKCLPAFLCDSAAHLDNQTHGIYNLNRIQIPVYRPAVPADNACMVLCVSLLP